MWENWPEILVHNSKVYYIQYSDLHPVNRLHADCVKYFLNDETLSQIFCFFIFVLRNRKGGDIN